MKSHRYRITIAGGLGAAAREAFEGLDVEVRGEFTDVSGILDQAALFGVLQRIQVFSLELVEVRRQDEVS
ncbi:MAG: hypothetical protein JWN96_2865 [Mycobacterium sp.]|jgi:hypothetical protein|nr:hypothetical protein [Mycobacterium sp.]